MKAQAKMDEFIWVLMAGLIVIIILLFAWGTQPTPEQNVTPPGKAVIAGPFFVGLTTQDVARNIGVGGFDVSYTVGSNVIAEGKNIEVKKGLFTNVNSKLSGRIEQDMSLVTDGFITVAILDTNSLGNLVIKVNDNVVFNQKASPGEITVQVSKDVLKSYNVIEISTSFPGWQFWATSVYKIDEVKFSVNFFGATEKTTDFTVSQSELENFKSGQISFTVTNHEGTGKLIVKINGRTVFSGIPQTDFITSFDRFEVGLARDINTISFSTEPGTTYSLSNALITITREDRGKKTFSTSFTVDQSALNKLTGEDKGRIRFMIVDSNFLGSLRITITDAAGVTHQIDTITADSKGEIKTVSFDDSDVALGSNKLSFEATGDGNFTLSNLEI